jgi:4-amino-4-deoxy-L-arabinose transferase-like glycosyltransferase
LKTPAPANTKPEPAPDFPRLQHWLAAHQRLVIGLLIGVSVLVRIVYFAQLAGGPCAVLHQYRQTDMNFFDLWARRIAGGDWLSNAPLHPLHRWHRQVADDYFAKNPEKLAEFSGIPGVDGAPFSPAEALWNHWYGDKTFHQEPLYPYLIAITYRLFGADVHGVFVWQLALGVATNVLIYLVTRRHFGLIPAAVAGTMAALGGSLLFFEMVLLRTSLEVFAAIGMVWMLDRARDRKSLPAWLLAGFTQGLAVLLKMTFVLFWIGAVGLVAWENRRRPKQLLRAAGVLSVGLAIALLPAVARNVAVGAPPLALSSVGPVTFAGANIAGAPLGRGFHSATAELPDIMGPADGRFLPVIRRTLATHDGVGAYVAYLAKKLAIALHHFEIPNNANFYLFQLYSPVLRVLVVNFALVGPLAVVGIGLTLAARRQAGSLYLLVITSIVPLVAFYVLARFRAPLQAGLIPFAALALVQLATAVRSRRWGRVAAVAGGVVVVGLWTWQPLASDRALTQRSDHEGVYEAYYQAAHEAAAARGDYVQAAAAMAELCDHMPPPLHETPLPQPLDPDSAWNAAFFAQVWDARAKYLSAAGRSAESAACAARAAALAAASR